MQQPGPEAPPAPPPTIASLEVPEALPAYKRGDFIGDLFQVIETLGEGGFGIVYLARSLASNSIVALKTLRGELLRDATTRAMFHKEARIWMDLGTHPNLVRAKWIDEVGGRLYIAMEYVQAGAGRPNSLEGYLEKAAIPEDKALLWAIQFCRGMEYAVSKGIRCHRDIKPANILIGDDSVVKISDFGIAGLALVPEAPQEASGSAPAPDAGKDPGKTVVGTVFGTPTHMSPEQFVDAASCDERSDIYSFGVVLYQMASGGRLPFRPAPPPKEMFGQAGAYFWHAFRTLHTNAAEAPLDSPLAPMITRALRKRRDDRYPNFAALRADLEVLYETAKGEKAPAQAGGKESAKDWNEKGMSLATLGRWAEALDCYDKAIALEPAAAPLHNNRGNALKRLRRVDESLAGYDKAIALDPLYAAAFENKALLYANAQRNEEALACVDRSIVLDPTKADPHVIRGVLLGRLGRAQEEIEAYQSAIKIDPRNVDAWVNQANALSTVNRVLAIQCVDNALSCDPACVSAWDLKGTLLSELGRGAESVACHQEAVKLNPRDGRLQYNLGNSWASIGRLEEALASYEAATRLASDMPLAWYNLAVTLVRLGLHARSVPTFERFLSFDPPKDGLRRTAERLTSEIKAGRTPDLGPITIGSRITPAEKASIDAGLLPQLQAAPSPALPSLTPVGARAAPPRTEEPLPGQKPDPEALALEAAAHFKASRFNEALAVVDRVLASDPRDGKALNTRANALFKLGRRDEAMVAIVKAIEASPAMLAFWMNKAVMEQDGGRLGDACRSAIDLAEIGQAEGAKTPSVEQARRLIASLSAKGVIPPPRGYLAWLGLGYASMVLGRTGAALEFFDKALADAPENIEVLRWKGNALKQLKRADDALAIFDHAQALAPRDPEIHHDRGIVLAMLREFERAVEAFDLALKLDPNHVASLSDKGKYAGELKRHEEALVALRRAAALMPDHPAPWLNKALVEDLLEREEDALISHEKFLERAKPEMRLQIEASKRRVEQLRARLAARKATPPLTASSPAKATPAKSTPIDDPFLQSVASLFDEDGGEMSDEDLARLAKALDGDDAGTLLEMLRAGGGLEAPPLLPKPAPMPPGPPSIPAPPDATSLPAGLAPATKSDETQQRGKLLVLPDVSVPTITARFSHAECLKRSEMARNQASFDKALEFADQAIAADSSQSMAWLSKAEALFGLKRYADAAAHAKKAVDLNPAFAPAWVRFASSLDALNANEQALGAWEKTVKLAGQNVLNWCARGQCLERMGRIGDALASHDKALAIDPRFSLAKFHKGRLEAGLGRKDAAILAFQQFLALAPPNLAALAQEARKRLQELKA